MVKLGAKSESSDTSELETEFPAWEVSPSPFAVVGACVVPPQATIISTAMDNNGRVAMDSNPSAALDSPNGWKALERTHAATE